MASPPDRFSYTSDITIELTDELSLEVEVSPVWLLFGSGATAPEEAGTCSCTDQESERSNGRPIVSSLQTELENPPSELQLDAQADAELCCATVTHRMAWTSAAGSKRWASWK